MHVREHTDWLDRVHDILSERFRERLIMARIAHEVGVHPVYLSATFRKRYGYTMSACVHTLRMNLAKERLRQSEDTIRCIARTCGFYDQGAFAKAFKEDAGATPGAYRLRFR